MNKIIILILLILFLVTFTKTKKEMFTSDVVSVNNIMSDKFFKVIKIYYMFDEEPGKFYIYNLDINNMVKIEIDKLFKKIRKHHFDEYNRVVEISHKNLKLLKLPKGFNTLVLKDKDYRLFKNYNVGVQCVKNKRLDNYGTVNMIGQQYHDECIQHESLDKPTSISSYSKPIISSTKSTATSTTTTSTKSTK